MDAIELALHRENTKAFIAERPSSIVLQTKGERQRTSGGGWTESAGTPRPPQTFRIIETSGRYNNPKYKTQDGQERDVEFWLLGEWSAQVSVGDWWTEGGREWKVADVIRSNGYETRAIIEERGR